MNYRFMKVDIATLLSIFDKLLDFPTDKELGIYWFDTTREDGLIVTLSFSIYECYVSVLVCNDSDVTIASVHMNKCSEIRVFDAKKKHLEIIHDGLSGRCLLQLTGNTVLVYAE